MNNLIYSKLVWRSKLEIYNECLMPDSAGCARRQILTNTAKIYNSICWVRSMQVFTGRVDILGALTFEGETEVSAWIWLIYAVCTADSHSRLLDQNRSWTPQSDSHSPLPIHCPLYLSKKLVTVFPSQQPPVVVFFGLCVNQILCFEVSTWLNNLKQMLEGEGSSSPCRSRSLSEFMSWIVWMLLAVKTHSTVYIALNCIIHNVLTKRLNSK